MKVKGGGKRKLLAGGAGGGNPAPNDAVETNNDAVEQENDGSNDNNGYQCLDVNEDTQVREGEKDGDEREGAGQGKENEVEDEEQEQEEEEEDEEEELPHDEAQDDRPKLDEGFFEIEAIRRRRVRKGQLQYLIKWRGWPETSNTWEPLENLQSCSDVIDVFEESLRSGKFSRKRKRKYGAPHTFSKKKQTRNSNATYNVTGLVGQSLATVALVNTSLTYLPSPTQSIASGHRENNGDVSDVRTRKQTNENRLANGSKQIDVREEETEYDPKLSELKGTMSTNEINADKLAIQIQEAKSSEVNGLAHVPSKVDRAEQVHSDRRTGAKRRKSGSVKRFKQDLASSKLAVAQDLMPSIATKYVGTCEQVGIGNSSHKNKSDDSRNASAIVKIIKPIDFSASVSDNVQDVLVTFVAARSDGQEVMVDNKFLKANDPLLLINFYEQHLKYNANAQ